MPHQSPLCHLCCPLKDPVCPVPHRSPLCHLRCPLKDPVCPMPQHFRTLHLERQKPLRCPKKSLQGILSGEPRALPAKERRVPPARERRALPAREPRALPAREPKLHRDDEHQKNGAFCIDIIFRPNVIMSLFYVWYSITYLAWYALLSGEIQGGDSSKNTIKQPDDVIGNEITGPTKKNPRRSFPQSRTK